MTLQSGDNLENNNKSNLESPYNLLKNNSASLNFFVAKSQIIQEVNFIHNNLIVLQDMIDKIVRKNTLVIHTRNITDSDKSYLFDIDDMLSKLGKFCHSLSDIMVLISVAKHSAEISNISYNIQAIEEKVSFLVKNKPLLFVDGFDIDRAQYIFLENLSLNNSYNTKDNAANKNTNEISITNNITVDSIKKTSTIYVKEIFNYWYNEILQLPVLIKTSNVDTLNSYLDIINIVSNKLNTINTAIMKFITGLSETYNECSYE